MASYGFKFDSTAPVASATRLAAAECQRLVPHTARRQLHGDRRALRAVDPATRSQDLRRPGQLRRLRSAASAATRPGNAGSASLAVKYDATAPVATATASRLPNANGWYRAPLDVSFAATDAVSGSSDLRSSQELRRAGQRDGSRQRRLHGQGGKQRRGLAHAQVRRHGSGRDRNSVAPAERERLVPDSPRRQLRRDGRPVGAPDLRPSQELRRAGQRGGSRQRCLLGQGGKQRRRRAHAQVRRHGSGRNRNSVAPTERQRLVPGSPRRQLRRDGRGVRSSDLRSSQELRRAGQWGGGRQRRLFGQGGKQRRGIAHAQVRHDRPLGNDHALAPAECQRVVQRLGERRIRVDGPNFRARGLPGREELQRARRRLRRGQRHMPR